MQTPHKPCAAQHTHPAAGGRRPPVRTPRRWLHKRALLAVTLLLGAIGSTYAFRSVHDSINYNVLLQIRDETRATKVNAGNTEDAVKEADRKVAPQWNAGGNQGAYNPYTEREDEKKYGYAEMEAEEREQTLNMDMRCGGTQTFTNKTLWKVPAVGGGNTSESSASNGLDSVQRESCMRLVAAENLRFNEIIKMHTRIKQRNQALKKLAERRGDIDQSGQLAVSDNNLQLFVADSQVEIQYIHATIAAYDSLIASLKQSLDINAKQALVGKPSEAATTARLATLEAALGIL